MSPRICGKNSNLSQVRILGPKSPKSYKGYLVIVLIFSVFELKVAHAGLARYFTLDGKLTALDGVTPLQDTNLQIKLQILNPAQDCILYEEVQTGLNTVGTSAKASGSFNVQVGSEVISSKRAAGDSGNLMTQVYSNLAPINGKALSNSSANCTYNPTSGDDRYLRVVLTPSSDGQDRILTPNMAISSVPGAVVADSAESLQGMGANQFLNLATSTAPNLTQANAETIFSNTNYPRLTSLLSVPATNYLQNSANGALGITQVAGQPASGLTAGQMWYDSVGNTLKYYDGTAVKTLASGSSGVTSVTAASTAGNPIVLGGTITAPTIDLPKATSLTNGYLSSADWATFNGKQVAGNYMTALAGDVTATGPGSAAATIAANAITTTKINNLAVTDAKINDVGVNKITSSAGNYFTYKPNNAACTNGQILSWDNTNTRWVCANDAVGVGTVTAVSSANTDIAVATGSTTATLTLNTGTSANQIVKLDGTARLPAVDGSQLTNLPSAPVQSVAGRTGAVTLATTDVTGLGTAATKNVGTIAGTVAAGDDSRLTGALQSGSAAAGDLSGTYPNPSVAKISGTAININTLTSGDFLKYNGTNWINSTIASTDVSGLAAAIALNTSSKIDSSQMPASCGAGSTLTFTAPSNSWSCTALSIGWSQITSGKPTNLNGYGITDAIQNVGTGATSNVLAMSAGLEAAKPGSPLAGQVFMATDTQKIFRYNGTSWDVIATASGAGGTITSFASAGTAGNPIVVAGTATSPTVDIPTATSSANGYLSSTDWSTFNSKQAAGNYLSDLTGDVTASGPGSAAATIAANAITTTKINNLAVNDAKINDVGVNKITSSAGNYFTYKPNNAACTSGQILSWDNTNSRWVCANDANSGGTVTAVSSANADLAVATGTSTPTLTLNTGTAANQIVKLDGTARLPAVDGSQLTNLPSAPVQSVAGRTGTITLSNTDISGLGNAATKSVGTTAGTVAAGDDTRIVNSLQSGTSFVGDVSGAYNATSVDKIKGKAVSASPTLAGQMLRYDGTNYTPGFVAMTDLRSNVTGSSSFASTCGAGQTLSYNSVGDIMTCTNIAIANTQVSGLGTAAILNVGTAANNLIQLDATPKLPAVDGSALTNLNASNLASGTLAASFGGTGQATYAVGDLLYASTTTALSRLPAGSAGQVLSLNSSSVPIWTGLPGSAPPTSGSSILKGDGSGGFSSAVAGTDFVAPVTTVNGHALSTNVTVTATDVGLGNLSNVAQEPALGNPGTNGFTLSSTTAGTRSWIQSLIPANIGVTVQGYSASTTVLGNTTTGSGSIVLATSPTLTTPALGVATATSVNKVAITAPATAATLTIANNKTLTVSNSLSLAGTDGTTMTFPSSSSTLMANDYSNASGSASVNSSYEGIAAYTNSSTAYTIPDTASNIRRITLTGNATITLPAFTTPTGKMYTLTLYLKQDATGSRTVSFTGNGSDTIEWDSGAAPTISATASKVTIINLMKAADETVWYGSMVWKAN